MCHNCILLSATGVDVKESELSQAATEQLLLQPFSHTKRNKEFTNSNVHAACLSAMTTSIKYQSAAPGHTFLLLPFL